MPRIDAPTVAEHRAQIQARLVNAAEQILRAEPPQQLTAGAVSAAAGIARNSIYRYVESIDDLRALVVARYLPAWVDAVDAAMADAEGPQEKVVAWVRANIEQAAATGHGWLTEAFRSTPLSEDLIERAHTGLRDSLAQAWTELANGDRDRAAVAAALTMGITETGFRQLDAGRSAELVLDMCSEAVRSIVVGLARP
ncbi:TetR/AcrR family transcriptional regulator [Smaragdicoccus niigatensis]|uniref:TetR/AcrR family transcriptional regulator n=1 Tax=Smaragdicoccus niigatensis TaxID=359359 RepID=UPI0003674D49|nr:TetR/AcrR family transcriptional regulator [Smaragdicoccus niigatensis]